MSDFFGIGPAIKAVTTVYLQSARGSGRTVSLINSLKDGDRVIFHQERYAQHVQRMAKERGVTIDYIVVDPTQPQRLFERGSSQGRTIFDHSWVEQFYLQAIDHADKQIRHWQTESSGPGEPHLETRHKAEQMRKWQPWL